MLLYICLFCVFYVRSGEVRPFKNDFPKPSEVIEFNKEKLNQIKSQENIDLISFHHSMSGLVSAFPTPPENDVVMMELCVILSKERTNAKVVDFYAMFGDTKNFFV